MILSKLFKAKWQHKNATIRIEALNDFDLNDVAKVNILQQILDNDESELVRRAALVKFSQYSVCLNASKNNSQPAIRNFAQSRVEEMILSTTSDLLSKEDKQNYLDECNKTAFLEQWLMGEHDELLLQQLLTKVNKPNLLSQFMVKTENIDLQRQILARIDDLNQLEKLQKRLAKGSIADELADKINAIKQAIEKPIKLRKQLQLLLSKLLALKEQTDYQLMNTRKQAIEQEWQSLITDLDCLPEQEKQQVEEKYQTISAQNQKVFAVKEEAHQQQLIVIEQQALKQQQLDSLNQNVKAISLQITQAVFENIELDIDAIEAQLQPLFAQTEQSNLAVEDKNKLHSQLKQLSKKLQQLPHVAECVATATNLISKLSTLAIPSTLEELNQRKPIFDDWNKQWQHINKLVDDSLPQSILSARDELQQNWSKALQPLIKEQQHLSIVIHKKHGELKRLISAGKYKAAFGLHKKLTFMIADLSKQQQDKFNKEFEQTNIRIKELHELEYFIVTPKKQQLLSEIQQLVVTPLDNPSDQANKVKEFRKQWTLLGHADEGLDQELNQEFNKASELAFAPCRAFYAEQSKIRSHHLEQKNQVLEQLRTLTLETQQPDVNWRIVDNRLQKLNSLWREAGDIDRSEYQKIIVVYRNLVNPIKKAIHQFHDDNVSAKKDLIIQAKLQLDNEDFLAAIDKVKAIQHKWTDIGYAGAKQENSLWQTFRKVNDQIFARRDEANELQKQADVAKQNEFNQQFETLNATIETVQDLPMQKQLIADFETFIAQLKQQTPIQKGLLGKANTCISIVNDKINLAKTVKQQQQFIDLFCFVEEIGKGAIDSESLVAQPTFQQLSNHWQKLLKQFVSTELGNEARQQKTLELEILASVQTPAEFAEQRMQTQVNMLSDKLTQGDTVSLEDKLEQWLACGLIGNDKQNCISRVKNIFITP